MINPQNNQTYSSDDLPNLFLKVLGMNNINDLIENYEMLIDSQKAVSMSTRNINIIQDYINKIHLIPLYLKNVLNKKEFETLYKLYNESEFFVNMLKKKILNLITSNIEHEYKKYRNPNDLYGR